MGYPSVLHKGRRKAQCSIMELAIPWRKGRVVSYPHRIGLRAVHVPKEEITEFNWVNPGKQKSPLHGSVMIVKSQKEGLRTFEKAHHFRLRW